MSANRYPFQMAGRVPAGGVVLRIFTVTGLVGGDPARGDIAPLRYRRRPPGER
jgi:hypothetical protein